MSKNIRKYLNYSFCKTLFKYNNITCNVATHENDFLVSVACNGRYESDDFYYCRIYNTFDLTLNLIYNRREK